MPAFPPVKHLRCDSGPAGPPLRSRRSYPHRLPEEDRPSCAGDPNFIGPARGGCPLAGFRLYSEWASTGFGCGLPIRSPPTYWQPGNTEEICFMHIYTYMFRCSIGLIAMLSFGVTFNAFWDTVKSFWATLNAFWVTLNAFWVAFKMFCVLFV